MRPSIVMRMETPDENLALAAANGDRSAFAALAERHYDRLFGLAWRLTGNRAEAEDLVQDILLSLPRKLSGWRSESRFTTWLYRVAVNAAHDQRRRQAVRDRAATGWGDWERARQAGQTRARAEDAWLRDAMARLPQDLRETVALVFDEEMTQARAAEVLGLSEGTVAWRMSEVRRRLRALAQEEAGS